MRSTYGGGIRRTIVKTYVQGRVRRPRVPSKGVLLVVALSVLSPTVTASADEDVKAACLQDHERSQVLRMEGELLSARSALERCARRECPPAVVDDCVRWHDEVKALVPSIILAAKSERGDEPGVRVYIDGEPVTEPLEGRPMELDPGSYQLRFVLPGRKPIERQIIVREGDQYRPITVDFSPPEPKRESEAKGTPHRPTPTAVYYLGAVGAVGLVASAGFALSARSERNDALDSCAPLCDESTVDRVRTKAMVADVAAGVGVVGLALAGYVYWSRPTEYLPVVAASDSKLVVGLRGSY